MSTITSPRIQSNLTTPNSSRRPSLDTGPTSPTRPGHNIQTSHQQSPQQQRRNRAALRDYYNLKSLPSARQQQQQQHSQHSDDATGQEEVQHSELDKAGFDAESYVQSVLEKEGLEGVLREEVGLVNEIKSLDGERKALVYDNYSKLIAATDTIRKMRSNMGPLFPTTSTLSPAISHIAETATALSASLQASSTVSKRPTSASGNDVLTDSTKNASSKRSQRETVRRLLKTPVRMQALIADGKEGEARKEWENAEMILDKWEKANDGKVGGIEELRREGREVLKRMKSQTRK
ncbi:MAG: hypothetical protein M1837_002031 [Sclerophora amabilis]|nr:MAG: hypothetical protein M1837_002031 [Sclerophora amabilis]